ncbi:MAG TPA: VTT domain-containing protein [Chlamydiales bacterium]|nr:VTT domain-containing protein [Chlamydiales bacterium]
MNTNRSSRLYFWATQKAISPKAPFWIGLLFFLELILLIPLDAILMFFCLQKKSNIFLYIIIATTASLASGIIGYLLGYFLWDLIGSYIVPHLISTTSFERVSKQLQFYENWAVFFGSLLPFPLKALSLGSGVFHLRILPFSLCLFGARLIRFFVIGGAMALWGEQMKQFVERHFHRIILVIGAKIGVVFLFFWAISSD